jgi:hypothetical protein
MPATILYGADGNPLIQQSKAIVEPSFGALRTVLKPMDWAFTNVVGGHYRADMILNGGLTGLAANAPIVAFRWAPAGANALVAIPLRVTIGYAVITANTALMVVDAEMIRATAFSVQDGGTQVAVVPNRLRNNQSMAASQASLVYASSTGALTAGTRTLDANGVGCVVLDSQPATGVIRSSLPLDLYKLDEAGAQHPLVLGSNEGFIIRVPSAYGATAVIRYYITMEWLETPVF